MLDRLVMRNFTVFDEVNLEFSPGVNLFIGENGTGKTHLLKLLYSILEAKRVAPASPKIAEKLQRVFLPRDKHIGRLVRRQKGSSNCEVQAFRKNRRLTSSGSAITQRTISIWMTIGKMKPAFPSIFRSKKCWQMHRGFARCIPARRFTSKKSITTS